MTTEPPAASGDHTPNTPAVRQPAPVPAATPAGWYPHPTERPVTLRWWDGKTWTDQVSPLPAPQVRMAAPMPAYMARPQYVGGLSTGQHIIFGAVTLLTCGLFAPFWILAWWLGRKRIR